MTDMDKYRVTLTAEERADLELLVSSGKAAARKLTHARILLLADDSLGEECPDEGIVAALGTSLRTVSRVRQQLVTEGVEGKCNHSGVTQVQALGSHPGSLSMARNPL
jgi:hypothetical protein